MAFPIKQANGTTVWYTSDGSGRAFSSEADAIAAESDSSLGAVDEFVVSTSPTYVLRPEGTGGSYTQAQLKKRQEVFSSGIGDLNRDGELNDLDIQLSKTPYGTPVSAGGTATQHQVTQEAIGTKNVMRNGHEGTYRHNSPAESTIVQPGAPVGPSAGTQQAREDQEEAEREFDDQKDESDLRQVQDRMRILDAIDQIGRDNSLSEESRQQQRRALGLQEELLDRILGFDAKQYATQFADNALARQTALARSAPGGAASRQAGIFEALEQAPAIQAEAQRQAQALENQRLQQAQAAVGKFGDLAYGVRAQDAQQEEFDAELTEAVANQFQDIYKTDSAYDLGILNVMSDIYIEGIRNTRGFAEMDSDQKMAWWREETARRGQDMEFERAMTEIKKKYPKENPIDVWLGRFTKAGATIISAKTAKLI